jgi:leucine dehydrogenase
MLFRSYGRFVQGLGGRYITAEDVGTSVQDMEWVRMETDFVVGISRGLGGSGDPSPLTAFGCYEAIIASLKWQTGKESMAGRTVAIQGVGHVGYHLVKHVIHGGGRVVVTDIDQESLRRVADEFTGVEVVAPDRIYSVECDVFAPCALGAVINDETIPQLRCGIVCGSANNILADEDKHAKALAAHDIVYAPDYVVNAGGLINVANELEGYNDERARKQVAGIYDVTMQIFRIAREENITTLAAANTLAERRIASVRRVKDTFVRHHPRRVMRHVP